MTETIKVYLWKRTKESFVHYPPDVLDNVIIKAMPNNRDSYDPENNAKNLAKMIMNCVPGNTLDLILDAIAEDILPMLKDESSVEILKSPYDIQNRIRGALQQLGN